MRAVRMCAAELTLRLASSAWYSLVLANSAALRRSMAGTLALGSRSAVIVFFQLR